ncbi:MAG: hypothetical protein NC543_01780 [bacterium]|nr:hypothetical protein [bacterium]MCM1373951.1 hypothetical protein [Muribaculum sp.]
MATKSFRVVPKINNNLIAIFVCVPATGESRQVALIECPNDNQLSDNVELAEELCKIYRKRLNKSI